MKPGFGHGQHRHEMLVDGGIDLLPAHGFLPVDDHEDHQRPEAQHDAQQGRDVAQEPKGESPVLHGGDYTPARTPADPVPLYPPIFRAMWLKLREKIFRSPPNRYKTCPPISAYFGKHALPSAPSVSRVKNPRSCLRCRYGVRRLNWSTGPIHSLREPLLTPPSRVATGGGRKRRRSLRKAFSSPAAARSKKRIFIDRRDGAPQIGRASCRERVFGRV